MKECSKCGSRELLSEFNRDRTTKDGRSPWCGECERDYAKRYYEENRERLLAEDRERAANRTEEQKEEFRAKERRYYRMNRERILARNRERFWENYEAFTAAERRYRERNLERVRAENRELAKATSEEERAELRRLQNRPRTRSEREEALEDSSFTPGDDDHLTYEDDDPLAILERAARRMEEARRAG